MYQQALREVLDFTNPFILSTAWPGGKCTSSIGAFMVLNEEGYVLTCNHMTADIESLGKKSAKYQTIQQEIASVSADSTLTRAKKRTATRKLRRNLKGLPIAVSPYWGRDGWVVQRVATWNAADISVGKIVDFDPATVQRFPLFKDEDDEVFPGIGLCRLGYPFHRVVPTYDPDTRKFTLPAETWPPPIFVNDGILARGIVVPDQNENAVFFQTTSPGLKGQSGGPIFDAQGRVWAMQSYNDTLSLGIDVQVPNRSGKAHQFMNTGLGVNSQTIRGFLNKHGIVVRVG